MAQSLSQVGLQNYYQKLVNHGLISLSRASQALETLSSPSVSNYPRCLFCSHLLITCCGCSNITCDNVGCKGANLMASCRLCFSTLALSKECSQIDCSTRAHFIDHKICPDCVKPTDGHIFCACGDTWVCGPCATQKTLNLCGRCPRCQNCFCFFRCRYIGVCVDCHKMTLCNDCMEEELSDEGSLSAHKSADLVATCEECGSRICIDCVEENGSRCDSCNSAYCKICSENEECLNCGALMCLDCSTEYGYGCQRCET